MSAVWSTLVCCGLLKTLCGLNFHFLAICSFKEIPTSASTNLSHAATSAQGAADLAKVIVIPMWQRCACTPNVVQVVQAAVIGELSERGKTAEKEEQNVTKDKKKRKCVTHMRYKEEN